MNSGPSENRPAPNRCTGWIGDLGTCVLRPNRLVLSQDAGSGISPRRKVKPLKDLPEPVPAHDLRECGSSSPRATRPHLRSHLRYSDYYRLLS